MDDNAAAKKKKRKQEELDRVKAWAKAEEEKKAAKRAARPTKRRKSSSFQGIDPKDEAKARAKAWAESQGIIPSSPVTATAAAGTTIHTTGSATAKRRSETAGSAQKLPAKKSKTASKQKAPASSVAKKEEEEDALANAQEWAQQQGISLHEEDGSDNSDVVMQQAATTQEPDTVVQQQQQPYMLPATAAPVVRRPIASRRDPPSHTTTTTAATAGTVEPPHHGKEDPVESPIVLRVHNEDPNPVEEEDIEEDIAPLQQQKRRRSLHVLAPLAVLGAMVSIGLWIMGMSHSYSINSPPTTALRCYKDNMFDDEQQQGEANRIPQDIPPHCIGVETRLACPGTCMNGVLVSCPMPLAYRQGQTCRWTRTARDQLHAVTQWVVTQTQQCNDGDDTTVCSHALFLDTWIGRDSPVFDLVRVLHAMDPRVPWTVSQAQTVVELAALHHSNDDNKHGGHPPLSIVPTTDPEGTVVWGIAVHPDAVLPSSWPGVRLVQTVVGGVFGSLLRAVGTVWMDRFRAAPWWTVATTVAVVVGSIVRFVVIQHDRQVQAMQQQQKNE